MPTLRRAPTQGAQTGSALVLSLLVVLTVVLFSGTFLQMSAAITNRQAQATDQKRSFYLSEAGLAESYAALRIGRNGNIGSAAEPARFGSGLFWVEATDLENGLIALESHGWSGTASTVLDLVVEEGSSSVAALGVFSGGDLEIPTDSLLDAYDSRKGPYVPPPPTEPTGKTGKLLGGLIDATLEDEVVLVTELDGPLRVYESIGSLNGARVSANGDVTIYEDLGDETRVIGDLRPGRGQTLTQNGSPAIAGTTDELLSPVGLPPVSAPVFEAAPGIVWSSATPLVLPAVQGAYDRLVVSANATVTVTGPSTIVLDELTLDQAAELVFDTSDGPIHVYVHQVLQVAPSSVLSFPEQDPTRLSLQYDGAADAAVLATGEFFGLLFAPSARMTIGASLEVFGAAIASELEFEGPARVHFDRALGEQAETAALPKLYSWRIVSLEGSAAPSGDPFLTLGVTKEALPKPSEAWEDQPIKLEYYDRAGTLQVYAGMESLFDWSLVGQVLSITRENEVVGGVLGLGGIGGVGKGTGTVGLGL